MLNLRYMWLPFVTVGLLATEALGLMPKHQTCPPDFTLSGQQRWVQGEGATLEDGALTLVFFFSLDGDGHGTIEVRSLGIFSVPTSYFKADSTVLITLAVYAGDDRGCKGGERLTEEI